VVDRSDGSVWAEVSGAGDELTDPVAKHADIYPAPTGSRLTHDQSLAFGAALMTFSESVRGALDLGIRLSQLRVRAVVQPGNAPSTWLLDLAIELGGSGTHVQLDDLATAAARSPRTIEVLSKRWTVSIRSPSVQVVPTGLPRVM